MRTPSKRTVGLLSTVLGIASIGLALMPTAAYAALDANPATRELKETQRYATIGDVGTGDCGSVFDPTKGIIWHFIADSMVDGSVLVSWTATYAASKNGPVVETVTAMPEQKTVGNGKTYHFYSQSQNLFLVNVVATFDRDQSLTEQDMQLSHICGASIPSTTTSTTVATTSTTLATTTTAAPTTTSTTAAPTTTSTTAAPTTTSTTAAPTTTSTTAAPTTTSTTLAPTTTTLVENTTTTEATVLPTTLVQELTTTTAAAPTTSTTLPTEVQGVQQVRQLPRTGSDFKPMAYVGIFLVGFGLVLTGQQRKSRSF